MVGSEKLGFMASSARLLTGVSRAADGLVIITNTIALNVSEHKRKKHQYDYLRHLIGPNVYADFLNPLPHLNIFMRHDGQDENEEWGSNEGWGSTLTNDQATTSGYPAAKPDDVFILHNERNGEL